MAFDEEGSEGRKEVEEGPDSPEQQQDREDPATRPAGHVDDFGVAGI